MKKVLSLIISIVMLLATFSASAATTEIGAGMDSDWYNVYVAGQADSSNANISVLLTEKATNMVGYITEISPDNSGKYETKFKFNGDIDDYTIKVRDCDTAEDITSKLTVATAQRDLYCIDVQVGESGNDVINYISENSSADIYANIYNKYGDNATASVLLAAYDENNKLITTVIKSLFIGYDDLNVTKKIDFSSINLPSETKVVKGFVWEDTVDLIPLAEQDSKRVSNSIAFENENPDGSMWVVGVVGDSITHFGQYLAFLYEYYATRYPDKNIVLLNKGIGGDASAQILARLPWDVYNENNPLLGACDEVAIMTGMNDSGYNQYTHGKMPDEEYIDYYKNLAQETGISWASMERNINDFATYYERVVKYCVETNKKVTLVTPSLYDESDKFVNSFPPIRYGSNYALGHLSEIVKNLGIKYNSPVLELYEASNEYTDRIREKYPEATTVITGDDGIHPDSNGGYLFGYLYARAQETNDTVAAVEINATANTTKTDNATVTNLNASASKVSYTYLPKALPLYAGSNGYEYVKGYGVDITNDINREIIMISNLDDGEYTVSLDGTVVCTYSDDDLAVGINIAELADNPGQTKAKAINEYIEQKRAAERSLRGFIRNNHNCEEAIKNAVSSEYFPAEYKNADLDALSADAWLDLATKFRKNYLDSNPAESSNDMPVSGIVTYITNKTNEISYNATIIGSITNIQAIKPAAYEVVIQKQ